MREKRKINKGIIIPEKPRAFTEAELELIRKIPYRQKTAGSNDKNLSRTLFVITLMEINGANTPKGCQMAVKELGKILGSNHTAADVIKGLCESIMTTNNHYNAKENLARFYKFTDKFKWCNAFAVIRHNREQAKIKSERELMIGRIIEAATTPYNVKRFKAYGFNPESPHLCECCGEDVPAILFSISKEGTLNDKCKVCWEIGPDVEALEKRILELKGKKKFRVSPGQNLELRLCELRLKSWKESIKVPESACA